MISIIGGEGFVGSRLRKVLEKAGKKYQSLDLNPANMDSIRVDVSSELAPDLFSGTDVIINLAAVHADNVRDKSLYYSVNVNGAVNVCTAASKANIHKIIFVSSVAVYGFPPPDVDENGAIAPFDDYGKSKYLAELEYLKWYNEAPETRHLTIVRPTVIFGEGNRGNVYNLISQIESKRFIFVGSGENKKSMSYVGNVAAYLAYATNAFDGLQLFNYVDKPDLTMNTFVSTARKELFGVENVGFRIYAWIGLLAGRLLDVVSRFTPQPLGISYIRIKKFINNTTYSTKISNSDFQPPSNLQEALVGTICHEFNPRSKKN